MDTLGGITPSPRRTFPTADPRGRGALTHAGVPLQSGSVDISGSDAVFTCPAHGSRFSLDDGRVIGPPAQSPLPTFPVRVADGGVQLLVNR